MKLRKRSDKRSGEWKLSSAGTANAKWARAQRVGLGQKGKQFSLLRDFLRFPYDRFGRHYENERIKLKSYNEAVLFFNAERSCSPIALQGFSTVFYELHANAGNCGATIPAPRQLACNVSSSKIIGRLKFPEHAPVVSRTQPPCRPAIRLGLTTTA